MVPRNDDTIAAIATPPGEGAIAVVRLSGPAALRLADTVFRGRTLLSDAAGYTAHPGQILHPSGVLLDKAIVTVFKSPHSYTGEDCAEISCHGGSFVTQRVLDAVLAAGTRPAEPGEFTRRAFLNGHLDLTQAEAVADLIGAHCEKARKVSLEQLHGRLGGEIRRVRKLLVELCGTIELGLDFVEEGIELSSNTEIREKTEYAHALIGRLLRSYETGKVYRDGVTVSITGAPNVGKSSIFNALLEHDRAIVTHVPGTTRDTLEESITLSGILFRLVDTAGLRESNDIVETEGIERARRAIAGADIVLLVRDASEKGPDSDPGPKLANPHQQLLEVRNKSDLLPPFTAMSTGRDPDTLRVSALTGEGLDNLRALLVKSVSHQGAPAEETLIVSRRRHREALQRANDSLGLALKAIENSAAGEFVAIDLRAAADSLGEITGEVTSEEILNAIFSSFCVGK